MRAAIFNKHLKDLNSSLKKAVKSTTMLKSMTDWQKEDYYKAVQKFQPKTGESIDNKKILLEQLGTMLKKEGDILTKGEKIANNSCVFEIHIRQPGFRRKLNSATFLNISGNNGNVDDSILHVSQDLIERKELKDLKTHRSNFLNYVRSLEVPGGMLTLGNGQHLIPLVYVEQIKDRLDQFVEERKEKIDQFEARYPEIIETAKIKRGAFFNANDYPPFIEIRNKYAEEHRFISNNVPQELEKVSKRLYEQEKERIAVACASACEEIHAASRSAFADLIGHYADRLGNDEDTGKPKKFYESGTSKLKEFIEQFNTINLIDDPDLKTLVQKAQALIDNSDITKIRSDEEFRASLSSSFQKLKDESDKLIVIKARKFDLKGE